MPTQAKRDKVAELTDKMERMQFGVITDYRGLTVAEIADLRAKLREHGAEVVVAKNTLLKIAAANSNKSALDELLAGPTAITFAYDNISDVAKAMDEYAKAMPKISVRGGILGTSLIQPDGLKDVAKLPTRQQMLGEILGATVAPLTGLVSVVGAPVNDIFNIVNTIASDIPAVIQARIQQLEGGEGGEGAAAA